MNIQKLQLHYNITLPIMHEKYLTSLITRQMATDSILQKAEKFTINLQGNGYITAVISIEHSNNELTEQMVSSLVNSDDIDLKLFAINNVASEVWKQVIEGQVFIHQEAVIVIGINRMSSRSSYLFARLN